MASVFTKEYQTLAAELGLTNPHAVPHLTRVVVNVGVGKQRDNAAFLKAVREDLARITGAAPHERRARKAVASFSVRQGNLVGYRVTLRGQRMEEFVQRFVRVTLPRVRDFQGIQVSQFDGAGNLSVGLREQLPFPEVHPEQTDAVFGIELTFVTSATDNATGERLLRQLGFPLTTEAAESVAPVRRKAPRRVKSKPKP